MNPLMTERNMEKNGSKTNEYKQEIPYNNFLSSRHNILELIETEKEYVKDLALIVEVRSFELVCLSIISYFLLSGLYEYH